MDKLKEIEPKRPRPPRSIWITYDPQGKPVATSHTPTFQRLSPLNKLIALAWAMPESVEDCKAGYRIIPEDGYHAIRLGYRIHKHSLR